MSGETRIVLADDHPIVLNGLRNLVAAERDFELVGEASSGTEALRVIRESRPDVAVIDISMPELNGIALSRRIAKEVASVKVLILTLHEDRAYLRQAIDAGVRGYLLKRSAAENLVRAIRAVVTGGLYVDPAIAHRLFDSTPKQGNGLKNGGMPDLTHREGDVLQLVALGYTNKEIARRLDIGVKSVETYKSAALRSSGSRHAQSSCATHPCRDGCRIFDLEKWSEPWTVNLQGRVSNPPLPHPPCAAPVAWCSPATDSGECFHHDQYRCEQQGRRCDISPGNASPALDERPRRKLQIGPVTPARLPRCSSRAGTMRVFP